MKPTSPTPWLLLLTAFVLACQGPAGRGPDAGDGDVSLPQPVYKQGTPDVVRQMIVAHGGMGPWKAAPTVTFRDRWARPDGSGWETLVTVEQDRRRAYLEVPGRDSSVVWDGERAWGINWEMPIPPRFLALLNYYFVCLPWLTQDPGVNLSVEGPVKILDDPTEYVAVRMTFDAGVGDTPDDYYVLYIDPRTKRLHGCRYVVTYEAVLPEGVEHTPEHILVYEGWTHQEGLLVPTGFTIHNLDGSVYARCDVSDWSLHEPFDTARMTMPQKAVVDTSKP